jgi:DNA invertase Pin-like site-specific DNA recombinase
LQLDALKRAGCANRIYKDTISGAKAARPELDHCLGNLRRGDTLFVWRLDRLGRSLKHLIQIVEQLSERGIGLRSLQEGLVDTSTATGRMFFQIIAVLAEFERNLIRERTNAGLASARARGRIGGRPRTRPDDPRVVAVKAMAAQGLPTSTIAAATKVSERTIYRFLRLKPSTNGHL